MDFIIEETEQTVNADRDIVPAGIHVMRIVNAEEGPNQYKVADANPEGLCLKLRLATVTGSYKFVFDDIPKHIGWKAKQLAVAVGILPVGGRLSLSPEDLHEQTLAVEVSHYTSKAGKVSAVVKRYVSPNEAPASPSKPAAKAAVKAASRKQLATASATPEDDIPF